jgi:hypothetical protein
VSVLAGIAALVLGVVAALSVPAAAATHRGQGVDSVSTTTTVPIELGPASSVTEEPVSDVPGTVPAAVRGKRVIVDDRGGSASWAWWLLMLLLAPVVVFVFGRTRRSAHSPRR